MRSMAGSERADGEWGVVAGTQTVSDKGMEGAGRPTDCPKRQQDGCKVVISNGHWNSANSTARQSGETNPGQN